MRNRAEGVGDRVLPEALKGLYVDGTFGRDLLEAMEVSAIPGGMPGLWLGVETLRDILEAKGQEFE